MELKPRIKLTEDKSNQINFCNSLDTIFSNRKIIKIKSKQKSLLTEGISNIKKNKLSNFMQFPNLKRIIISNKNKSPKNIETNTSSINNIQTLEKSKSYRGNILKNTDYININSLFSYPKVIITRNFPNKINYSNSIDVPNRQRILKNSKLKHFQFSTQTKSNSKMFPLKRKNKIKMDELHAIKNFMKMKYYEDTKVKLEKKLKDDSFIDKNDKDKLIQIGKFKIFWKNVLNYCGCLAFTQKMKNNKKSLMQNSVEETGNKIRLKKMPSNRLYTTILKSKLIHFKNNL